MFKCTHATALACLHHCTPSQQQQQQQQQQQEQQQQQDVPAHLQHWTRTLINKCSRTKACAPTCNRGRTSTSSCGSMPAMGLPVRLRTLSMPVWKAVRPRCIRPSWTRSASCTRLCEQRLECPCASGRTQGVKPRGSLDIFGPTLCNSLSLRRQRLAALGPHTIWLYVPALTIVACPACFKCKRVLPYTAGCLDPLSVGKGGLSPPE